MYVLNTQNPKAVNLAWMQVTTEWGPSMDSCTAPGAASCLAARGPSQMNRDSFYPWNNSNETKNPVSTFLKKTRVQRQVIVLWVATSKCDLGFRLTHACMLGPDSLGSYGLQPARLLCPWDFPGKNTGVGCHFLFQGIFPTRGSNPPLLQLLHWQAGPSPVSHLGSPDSDLRVPDFWSPHPVLRYADSVNAWNLYHTLLDNNHFHIWQPYKVVRTDTTVHSLHMKQPGFTNELF